MVRICISHCYIGDCGLKHLVNQLTDTRLTYVNFSWNHCTPKSVGDLCRFFRNNQQLEKVLIQHNNWGDKECLDKIANALNNHRSIKYLDISAMNIGDDDFLLLF